jgi:hypothetical protein
VSSAVVDSVYWRLHIPAGSVALVRLAAVAPDLAASNIQVTINQAPAPVASYEAGVLAFVVPRDLAPGVAALRITAGGRELPAVAMSIDFPAPVVWGAVSGALSVSAERPVQPGVKVGVVTSELREAASDASRLQVWVAGIYHPVLKVIPIQAGHLLEFELNAATPAGGQPLILVADGRLSPPFTLAVAGAE